MMIKNRILVADDDPAILDALKMMLEICDYEVETVMDGSVISKLHKKQPKLVLLDIWMSGYDGREICKKLKKNKQTRDIPVILISASQEGAQCTRESGANDFIAKPFDMAELLSKIEKHIVN